MATESYFGVTGMYAGRTFDKLLEFITPTDLTAATTTPALDIGSGLVDADLVVIVFSGTPPTMVIEMAEDAAFTVNAVTFQTANLQSGLQIVPFRNVVGNEQPRRYARLAFSTSGAVRVQAFLGKK